MISALPYLLMAFTAFWAFERLCSFVVEMVEHSKEGER